MKLIGLISEASFCSLAANGHKETIRPCAILARDFVLLLDGHGGNAPIRDELFPHDSSGRWRTGLIVNSDYGAITNAAQAADWRSVLVAALVKRTKLMFMIAPSGATCGGSDDSGIGSNGELFSAAAKARLSAYAPYSGFAVGAAVRTDSGAIFSGANVENAAFPVGICAEAAAIAAMVVAGERRIAEILIVAEGDALVTPCGACRQRIHEFAESDAKIYVAGIMGVRAVFTLGKLLPAAFGRSITKAGQP